MHVIRESSRRLEPRSEISRDDRFGWCVSSAGGDLTALDDELRDLARFRLPNDSLGTPAVSPDLRVAAISAESRVVVVGPEGLTTWEVPHPSWGRGDSERGSCWFSDDGRIVWAHVPTEDGPDEWLLIDAESGAISGRASLSCYSAGSSVIRHPDGIHVGMSVGEGQDGSETYFGRVEDDSPIVQRLDDRSRVLVSFSDDGAHFLTTPHSSGPLEIHSFPDGRVVGSVEPDATLEVDDEFDLFGGFIGPDLVLFTSVGRDDVVVSPAHDLGNSQVVPMPIARAGTFLWVVSGRFLVSDWLTGETTVWRLSV